MNLPIVSIVGRPNVGKSTLFNRLTGKRVAITAKEAGTTRDAVTSEISWNNKNFVLIDTAGLLFDFYCFTEEEIERKAQDKLAQSISSSDIILFVLDSKTGVTPEDKKAASLIRKHAKDVIVIWNKADDLKWENKIDEADELGFGVKIATSSITGRRSGQLLDLITAKIPLVEKPKENFKKISIIGRPNAGKSTLFNILADHDLAIVSKIPGTTRDTVKYEIEIGSKKAIIVDTAGFRRRGKVEVGIEKFSLLRAVESVYGSDIVILVIDATEGITRTDAHLGAMVLEKDKQLMIVLNKIDLLKNKSALEIKDFERYGFLRKHPMIGISAKTQENFELLLSEIEKRI